MSIDHSDYNKVTPFRAFCQKVLPLVYDDSLSYYELLCKILNNINQLTENYNLATDDIKRLYEYVNNYFSELNVQNEINNKLDQMAEDGTLDEIINEHIFGELNTEISNLKTNLTSLTEKQASDYTELNGKIADLTEKESSDYTKLKQSITDLANRKETVIIISDSYGDGYTSTGTIKSFLQMLKEMGELTSKFNIITSSQGGHGFANNGYYTQLNNVLATLENPDDVTQVHFVGGYNDRGLDSYEQADALYQFFKPKLKNAVFHTEYVASSNVNDFDTFSSSANNFFQGYNNYNQFTGYIPHPEMSTCLIPRKYMNTNDYHPNSAGQSRLANLMKQIILTGSGENSETFYENQVALTYKNGLVYFRAVNQFYMLDSPITVNPADSVALKQTTLARYMDSPMTQLSPFVQTTNAGNINMPGYLYIYNGYICFRSLNKEIVNNVKGFNCYNFNGVVQFYNCM